jgi:predicted nucleic acid-binding protein
MVYKKDYEELNDDIFLVSDGPINSFNKQDLLILDTSVIVKWFFRDNEKNKVKADIILNKYKDNKIKIIIPELSVSELVNVPRNKTVNYQNEQQDIIDGLYKMGIVFHTDKEILKMHSG